MKAALFTDKLIVRCTPDEKVAWQHAADADGRSLSDWARRAASTAALRSLHVGKPGERKVYVEVDAPKAAGAAGPAPVAAPAAPAGNPAALAPEVEDVRHPPKMKLGWSE